MKCIVLAVSVLLILISGCHAVEMKSTPAKIDISKLPAFPGAEGYGSLTRGGRGGKVYEVTNLNDSGEGSLRAAVEAEGPRTVIFRVSGTIDLKSGLRIKNPNITIAGQTAPGDGICIKRYPLMISANEVIVRYIRVRFGNESGKDSDAISSRFTKNIIVDHVSASWSVDETMSIYHCENITVQWCIISESMFNSNHVKGAHGFGGIWGSDNSTYHHNLLAHHSSRNPRFASGCGNTDYRNNVLYNWGYNSCYGGEKAQGSDPRFAFSNINMVANYYKPGPATRPGEVSYRIASPSTRDGADGYGKWYVADNFVDGDATVSADNWDGGVQPHGGKSFIAGLKLDQPWPAMAIHQQTAQEAYKSVLDNAGATLPKRDAVDARIVEEARNGTATYEGVTYKQKNPAIDKSRKCGIIDSQTDVGGWPELKSLPAPADTDHDGMPDEWERKHGLNPGDPSDSAMDADGDGYTNIEECINGTDPRAFVDYTRAENNINTLQ
jgi:pectate lyase